MTGVKTSEPMMTLQSGSLFEQIPRELPEEFVQTLYSAKQVRIERIVSKGQASPEGFWYDQEQDEFVLLVAGSAGLRIEGHEDILVLKPGDYLNIAARLKHRVEWTEAGCDTVWLAVHYSNPW